MSNASEVIHSEVHAAAVLAAAYAAVEAPAAALQHRQHGQQQQLSQQQRLSPAHCLHLPSPLLSFFLFFFL
jgi:hypothetical protein